MLKIKFIFAQVGRLTFTKIFAIACVEMFLFFIAMNSNYIFDYEFCEKYSY